MWFQWVREDKNDLGLCLNDTRDCGLWKGNFFENSLNHASVERCKTMMMMMMM